MIVTTRQTIMKPYKVVPYEMGAADVIDRATGEKVGYILAWAKGWSAYLTSAPGVELSFGTQPTPEELRSILGDTYEVTHTRYRKDAAERVWRNWR